MNNKFHDLHIYCIVNVNELSMYASLKLNYICISKCCKKEKNKLQFLYQKIL